MSEKNKTTDPSEKQLEYIQKTMRENHELRQVCLEVFKGLNQRNPSPQQLAHCSSELNRVLFDGEVFLH